MPNLLQATDASLWSAFKKGDKNALDTLFKSYYPFLYNYGIKLTGKENLTKDCLQDFFLYLYEHRHNLKDLDSIKPYLFKAFRNRLLQYLKTNANIISLSPSKIELLPIQFSIEEILIKKETAQEEIKELHRLLNQLSKRQKELIYLKYYNNLSISQIAEVMAISYQGVVNGLSKSMKRLKKARRVPVSILLILFFAATFY